MTTSDSNHRTDASGSASDHSARVDGFENGRAPPHPLEGVLKQVREVVEYANFYVETRKDVFRATLRSLVLKAILGVLAAVVGVTVLVVASVYAMRGIALAVALLFDERLAFLGYLITGFAILIGIAVAVFFAIKSVTKTARKRTIEKYERRQQQQRERFGHSVTSRAQQLRQSERS
jgi:hypothetical protein